MGFRKLFTQPLPNPPTPLPAGKGGIPEKLFLPLALLAFAVLLSIFGGRRKETPMEYPYGYTTRVLVDESIGIINSGTAWDPSISADGRFVAFHAEVVFKNKPYQNNGSAYVYDRKTGETVRVSVGKDGKPADGYHPVMSADGQYVAFSSNSMNEEGNSQNSNIYVRDLKKQQTMLVSVAYNEQPANGSSFEPSISADGRFVAFQSAASNLVQGDTNQTPDVFVYDLKTGEMKRASSASDGSEANGPSSYGVISAAGRYVVFYSKASNLAAGHVEGLGIFLHDLDTKKTISISADQGIPVQPPAHPAISADGRYIVYMGGHIPSSPSTEKDYGLYLYDRQSEKAEFLVKGVDGEPPESPVSWPSISADGRFVAFVSFAGNLVAGDSNRQTGIYVLDRKTGTIQRVSISSENVQADGPSHYPIISGDGQHIVFVSEARNLVEGYPRGAIGVFIHDISNWGDYPRIDARRFSLAPPFPGPYPPPKGAQRLNQATPFPGLYPPPKDTQRLNRATPFQGPYPAPEKESQANPYPQP